MQLSARSELPDPYKPLLGFKLSADRFADMAPPGPQYRRRAEILAATRRLLADEGHQKFTIRSVSEACGLTVQTIHNSFGCKLDLLRAAMNQHTIMMDSHALSQTRDPLLFLTLAHAYYQSAVERPAFMREFMFTVFSPRHPLRDSLFKFGTKLKLQVLSAMGRRNLLRSCVDPELAAEQIAYVNTFCLLEWAENDDIDRLYDRLIFGNGSILMGILVPEAATDVERWMSSPAGYKSGPIAIPESAGGVDSNLI